MLFTSTNDEGEEESRDLPTVFMVCPRCRGEGSHVNPSIDGNGITASEWHDDWDEKERETYMSGGYDVMCTECHGQRFVKVVDEEHLSEDEQGFYARCLKEEQAAAQERADDRRTRFMESGGY